jgi:hypothetical protein
MVYVKFLRSPDEIAPDTQWIGGWAKNLEDVKISRRQTRMDVEQEHLIMRIHKSAKF